LKLLYDLIQNNETDKLEQLCKSKSKEISELLLQSGFTDPRGYLSLETAIQNKNDKIVLILIEYCKPIINYQHQRRQKKPLLHTACMLSETPLTIIKTLVKNGADVNVLDIHGKTPLMYACENKNMEVITYLIKYGADVNQVMDSIDAQLVPELILLRDKYQCHYCGKHAIRRCAYCDTRYCSKECQIMDWKTHKLTHHNDKKREEDGEEEEVDSIDGGMTERMRERMRGMRERMRGGMRLRETKNKKLNRKTKRSNKKSNKNKINKRRTMNKNQK